MPSLIKHNINGFSLIELTVSIAIGAVIMLGLVAMYSNTVKHNNDTMAINRLDQELNATVQMMASDIRRAGYWSLAMNDIGTGVNSNPYMDASTGMDIQTNGPNNCILMSYDSYKDGVVKAINTAGDDERYGYRLQGTAIQARPTSANLSCGDPATAWEDITDSNIINITNFSVVKNETPFYINGGSTGPNVVIRDVNISITGQLVNNPNISKTVAYNVKVRNDKFVP